MIVITRPLIQSRELVDYLRKENIPFVNCPLIEISGLPQQSHITDFIHQYQGNTPASALQHVFCSVNAVNFALPYLSSFPLTQRQTCYSIGPATTKALTEAHFDSIIQSPKPYGSESLISLASLDSVVDCPFIIWQANDGRCVIQNSLIERQAKVCVAKVYQQQPLVPEVLKQQQIESATEVIILVTSVSILKQVKQYFYPPIKPKHQHKITLFCISERVFEQAKKQPQWGEVYNYQNCPLPELVSLLAGHLSD